MSRRRGERPRVLLSTPRPGPQTNPYVSQLQDSLREAGVDVVPFSWEAAVLGRYDVVHMHWPETLVHGRSALRTRVRQGLAAVLALRLALSGVPVVRTVHNLVPHERPRSRAARLVLSWLEARESWWVRLNDHTPVRDPGRAVTALHGHYRSWAAGRPVPDPVPGRLVTPGVVRPYKGLDELVEAFRRLEDDRATLHVVGRAEDAALAERLRTAAAQDPRLRLTLRHADDDELARAVGEAQLVVLPYRQIHNSGVLLLALSLGRPVLVPRAPVTESLAARVGQGWVLLADMHGPGAMTTSIERALATTAVLPADPPDLSAHDWATVAAVHVALYERATSRRRGPGA